MCVYIRQLIICYHKSLVAPTFALPPLTLPNMWSNTTIPMYTRDITSTVLGDIFKPDASSWKNANWLEPLAGLGLAQAAAAPALPGPGVALDLAIALCLAKSFLFSILIKIISLQIYIKLMH